MSAFMVDKTHIDALVDCAVWGPRCGRAHPGDYFTMRWWTVDAVTLRCTPLDHLDRVRREARPETADAIGAMLIAENLASIHHRYPDTLEGGPLPGPVAAYWEMDYVFERPNLAPTAIEGLKLINCYEYQACEHPGWPASEAQSFCHALRGRLIGRLDGYDAARWEWQAELLPPDADGATILPLRPEGH
jgi:hypothetical protein